MRPVWRWWEERMLLCYLGKGVYISVILDDRRGGSSLLEVPEGEERGL
jgi:hypothetical protein